MKRYIKANTTKAYYFIDPKGNLYKSYDLGFTSYTQDWNYDNDVYSMSVKYLYPIDPDSDNWHWIEEDSWDDYGLSPISPDKVKSLLHDRINEYFIEGESGGKYYYCDSTDGGKYHYGDYNFMHGGPCIYTTPEDREDAIQNEIQLCMK